MVRLPHLTFQLQQPKLLTQTIPAYSDADGGDTHTVTISPSVGWISISSG